MKKKVFAFPKRLLALALSLILVLHMVPALGIQTQAADEPTKIADASTQDIWSDIVNSNQSTKYLGRVWTDKTVSATGVSLEYKLSNDSVAPEHIQLQMADNADFQTVLSAVSSTASYMKTEYAQLPLDIVLVLDVSGSMANNYIYTYTAASAPYSSWGTYYVLDDGEYEAVEYEGTTNDGYYEFSTGGRWPTVYTTETHAVYTRTASTRLAALKTAATAFLREVRELNEGIADDNAKHRVSVVTFAGSGTARTRLDLTSNINTAITTINGLSANGGTYPNQGLELAADQLADARSNANKYVLFFTDGYPGGRHSTGNNGQFGEDTAAAAVNQANIIKNTYGATVYSVAVIDDATAADLSQSSISTSGNANTVNGESVIDYMMHGISSNYPSASAVDRTTNSQGAWTLNLGSRAAESNYYFATTDADELTTIFTEIAESVTSSGTGSATHITSGNESSADGYVTIVDELGDYMEIKSIDAITIEGGVYYYTDAGVGSNASTAGNGYTDTAYVFTKEVSLNTTLDARVAGTSSTENLNHILITERDYEDPAVRDTLTVQIPASMLPLRYYSVDDAGNLTIKETLPVRVVYSVGLLESVRTALASGDYSKVSGLAAYVAANTANNQICFYSNYSDGDDSNQDGYTDGNAYSTFAPAINNSFYYYTEDTPFVDANGDPIASTGSYETDLGGAKTVYYAHKYYQLEGTVTTEKTDLIGLSVEKAIDGIGITWSDIDKYIGVDGSGNYYMKKGFAKLSLANDVRFIEVKESNVTDTAATVLNPSWSYNISPDQTIGTDYANYKTMNYLGNNGLITYAGMGSLAISKTVSTADPMLDPAAEEFEFTITLGNAAAATYNATRTGKTATEAVAFDATGKATVKLKNGETLTITGLPAGVTYKVEEALPAGFAVIYSDNDGAPADAQGTVTTGATDVVDVLNTYSVTDAQSAFTLSGDKALLDENSAAVAAEHNFKFYLQAWNNTALRWEYVKADGTTTLEQSGGVTATAAYNGAAVAIDYSAINSALSAQKFSAVGIYTFRVIEANSGKTMNGIYHDKSSHSFEVAVADNGAGALYVASVTCAHTDGQEDHWTGSSAVNAWANADVDFTNTFGTTKLSINVDKAINDSTGNGYDDTSGYRFDVQYILRATDRLDLTGVGNVTGWNTYTTTAATKADGIAQFGMEYITHTGATGPQSLGNGKHQYPTNDGTTVTYYEYYKITENVPATQVEGIKYSDQVYYVEVAVQVTGNDVAATYSVMGRTDNEIVFVNTYFDETSVTLGATKNLTGRNWQSGDSFTFTLNPTQYTKDSVTLGEQFHLVSTGSGYKAVAGLNSSGAKPTATATSAAVAQFGSITFTAIGNYFFTVTENGTSRNGITYDSDAHFIMVAVSTDANYDLVAKVYSYELGTLTADAGVYNVANITNTYTAAPAAVTLGGNKTLNGAAPEADQFAFVLRDDTNAVVDAKLNDAQGRYTFDTLTFDKAGEYIYTVTEYDNGLGGVTYDATTYTVRIRVTDNMQGQLVASVWINGDQKVAGTEFGYYELNFANTYSATGSLVIPVTKTVDGRDWKQGDSFTFALYDEDPAQNPQALSKVTLTITAPEELPTGIQSIRDTFAPIEYTLADVGTHTYYIVEEGEDADGITVDTTVYVLEVEVTDNGDGELAIRLLLDERETNAQELSLGFVNTYVPEAAELTIYGDKILTNITPGTAEEDRDMNVAANAFTFKLEALTPGAPMPAATQVKNAAGGSFSFGPIEFTTAGEYLYKVTEVAGSQSVIGFDDTEYTVTVMVTDDSLGQLHAVIAESSKGTSADPVVFNNTYKAEGTAPVIIRGKKVLKDGELQDNQFSFVLKNNTGATVQTVKNQGGSFAFTGISFTTVGTYTYTVSEVKGSDEAVIYDDTVYTVRFEVVDGGDGKLYALPFTGTQADELQETNLEELSVTFTNTWVDLPPETGDSFNLTGIVLMMTMSLACMLAVLVLGKKRA